MATKITALTLRRLRLPLIRPYRLSYRTFEEFEPYLVEVADDSGAHRLCRRAYIARLQRGDARRWLGLYAGANSANARARCRRPPRPLRWPHFEDSKVATTALACAIEVLEDHPLLDCDSDTTLPLLTPDQCSRSGRHRKGNRSLARARFPHLQGESRQGRRVDLARVAIIQKAVGNRATLRLDANRAFDRDDGMRFASALDPAGIELFEQPCDSDDWDANAAVAAVSTVPLMLDEPICSSLTSSARRHQGRALLQAEAQAVRQSRTAARGANARARLRHGAGARRRAWQRSAELARSLRSAEHDPQCRRV